MGYLSERISYLKGLADGMKLNSETNEGRLLKEILEVLDDIAISVEDLEDEVNERTDDLENRCDDLEDFVYDEDDEYDDDLEDEEEDEEEDDDDDEIEIDTLTCPSCKGKVTITEDMINDDFTLFTCPLCGEEIELEWSCDDDCGECGCCGHKEDTEE